MVEVLSDVCFLDGHGDSERDDERVWSLGANVAGGVVGGRALYVQVQHGAEDCEWECGEGGGRFLGWYWFEPKSLALFVFGLVVFAVPGWSGLMAVAFRTCGRERVQVERPRRAGLGEGEDD